MCRRLVFCLLLCWPLLVPAADMARFYGTWQGRVLEIGATGEAIEYAVTIHLAPGDARVDYPALDCHGALVLRRQGARHLSFNDRLSHGTERCENHGRTELYWVAGGRLAYLWFDARGRPGVGGYLYRQQQLADSARPRHGRWIISGG